MVRKNFALILFIFGCVSLCSLTIRAEEPPKKPILIGVAAPLSGTLANFGEQGRVGAVVAAEEINKSGGVLGRPLKLEIADDGCEGKQGVMVASRFVDEKMDMVSHLCGPASLAASDVYKDENVIQMSAASSVTDYTGRGYPFVFRVYLGNDVQAAATARYLSSQQANKTLAVIHARDAYTQGLTEIITDLLKKQYHVEPDSIEATSEGQQDFTAIINHLKQGNIAVVYLGLWPKDIGLFLRQAHEQHYTPVFVTNDSATVPEIWNIAGKDSDGLIFTNAPDARKFSTAGEAIQEIRKRNFEPAGVTLYAYAMIETYAEAVKKAGTTDTAKVIEALKNNTFPTIIGPVRFDKDGNLLGLDFQIYVWRNGKYDYLR